MRGPIDYIVVGFDGNKFDGSILAALADAIDKNIISLVALSFVMKDGDGVVTTIDIASVGDAIITDFAQKYPPSNDQVVNEEDIDEIGELLENNSAAGLLAIEHVWAVPLKEAIINANGTLIAEGRIHPDAANELEGGN